MLHLQIQTLTWRKAVIVLAGALACGYAVTVLWYVATTPDIGLRCAFTPVITQQPASRDFIAEDGSLPQAGDRLIQVGPYPFPDEAQPRLWSQVLLLRDLLDLRHETPQRVDSLAQSRKLNHVLLGDKELVRVRFRRAEGGEGSVWCPMGSLPLEDLIPSILWFFLKVGLFVVGALVFWKRPNDRSAAQFFVLCLVTVGAYMGGYHWARIAVQPVLVLVFMVCAVLLPAVSLHFYLVFPRPKEFLERYPRRTLLAIYSPPLVFLVALGYGYLRLRWLRTGGFPEADVAEAWVGFRTLILVYLWMAALWYIACVVGLLHSYGAARDATERNQVKWILFGSVVALVPIGYTLYLINWKPDDFAAGAAVWYMFAASVCFTAAFAISITRYRLMQLDQILSSGMVYFLISFLVGVVYYAVVFAGMLVSRVIFKPPSLAGVLSVSTTALVLLLVLDLVRSRFKKALDRRFYREKHQLDRTLRRMGQAIEQLVDPPTLARRLLQASAELLNVSRGAVYLRDGDPPLYRLAGDLGQAPPLTELSPGCPLVEELQRRGAMVLRHGPAATNEPAQRQLRLLGGEVAHALAHEGKLLALLILGPKDLSFYNSEDLNLLDAFAQLTALALESAEGHHTIEVLNRDLRAKVDKISEQQRRILALQSQLTRQVPARAAPAEAAGAANGQMSPPGQEPAPSRGGILGSSQVVRQLLELARKVAATPSAVLIRGESGTGKELLARALHENSSRAAKAFVKVHCAALSPGLLESELFGHVKGAFTGAHRDKVGRFELADGGSVFLDEIGDISPEVQTKLLRVLQEKAFERVGSSDPTRVDVRIIAATHQDLEELIRQGRFREDLYYRLKVIEFHVPPLRERREDIPELVMHFLRVYAAHCGNDVTQIDDDALAVLKAHRWTGNIRELENVIHHAVVVAEGPTVTVDDLPAELAAAVPVQDEGVGPEWGQMAQTPAAGVRAEREEHGRRERERLVRALAAARGNKAEAARALGLPRSTLLSRLQKYGLS
ncbi:MAG TPA: sigma 54-interacting transcriptional regulator [Gemmataceae bacterium]|jgi:transcriptional regulator with GAF, ATPase, and Fis domain|nr:sigma 54-interacting transcriptional regulator [Gemmataceae bacterium]